MTTANSTRTAWQRMSPAEQTAHTERMKAEAAASRLRYRCAHGVGRPNVCRRCDADQRRDYRNGRL